MADALEAGDPTRERPRLLGRLAMLTDTVRGQLALLILAVIIPSVAASTLLLWDAFATHRAQISRQMVSTAHALSLGIDRDVGRAEAVVRALSASPYLDRGDFAALDAEARELAGPDSWIVVSDLNGAQKVNTFAPRGTAPSTLPGPARAGFIGDLERKGERVSNLFSGRVAKTPVVSVDLLARRGDRPAYVVSEIMRPRAVARVFDEQALPTGWIAAALDRDLTVISRYPEREGLVGKPATAQVRAQLSNDREGVFQSVSADGAPTLAGFSRSPITGWTVIVAMPRSELTAGLWRSLALVALTGLVLMALGLALAFWFGRGVVASVEGLARAADALGRGQTPMPPRTGVRETHAVADALETAARRLKLREAELKGLNETLEARVQDATERLVQAQKLEAVGRLTGGVAHDFNNLLTAVLGNLDLLARRVSDEKLSRYVANARDAAQRGARLTAQLLAFSRQQRLAPEPLDVNAVVESMAGLLGSTLGGAIRVHTELQPGLALALADRTQLELVILNLAINARDAMQDGGALTISTSTEVVTRGGGASSDPAAGAYVCLSVRDEGSGMTPEVRSRVFEPFFTTKGPGRGSGLGLSQVLGVIQQLGGGVTIDTFPGQGTLIRIFLPISSAAEASGRALAADADAVSLAGRRILVVDDDASVRASTASLLREAGAEVTEADGGKAALAPDSAGFDAALIDYAMPEINGADLAGRLARLPKPIPAVLMTGFAEVKALSDAWSGPVLQKPFDLDAVCAALAGVIAASPAVGP